MTAASTATVAPRSGSGFGGWDRGLHN
jgi:hypothetical protein